MTTNKTILYRLAVRYLHLWRRELRASFTRDWFLHGREEAVQRLAARRLFEVADYNWK